MQNPMWQNPIMQKMQQNNLPFPQTNPQIQNAINIAKQFGGTYKEAYYALARQKGVDPDSFLKSLK